MLRKGFSIGEVMKEGWLRFKERPWIWVSALFITWLILATHSLVINWLTGGETFLSLENLRLGKMPFEGRPLTHVELALISFVYALIRGGLLLGLFYMAIRVVDGLPIHIGHLFERFPYFFYYFIAEVLYVIIVAVGLILLIVPGLIWAARYALFPYFIADLKVGPVSALKMSAEATQGAKWDVLGLLILSKLLLIAGLLVLLIGVVVAIPVLFIAWAYVYRSLYPVVEVPVEAEVIDS